MEFFDVVSTRRSVRSYLPDMPADDLINKVLHAGMKAPTAGNKQPWEFIVVTSEEQRRAIAEVAREQFWMTTAPVHIACVGDLSRRVPDYAGPPLDETSEIFDLKQVIRDTAIAVEHLVLEAQSLGLGTCWVAWFTQEDMRRVLGTPGSTYVVAVITVGHPAEDPNPRPRRALDQIMRRERW